MSTFINPEQIASVRFYKKKVLSGYTYVPEKTRTGFFGEKITTPAYLKSSSTSDWFDFDIHDLEKVKHEYQISEDGVVWEMPYLEITLSGGETHTLRFSTDERAMTWIEEIGGGSGRGLIKL